MEGPNAGKLMENMQKTKKNTIFIEQMSIQLRNFWNLYVSVEPIFFDNFG